MRNLGSRFATVVAAALATLLVLTACAGSTATLGNESSDNDPSDTPSADAPTAEAEAASADPDSADPDSADPDSADPDSADPDSADPDSADPDSADPDSADPDSAEPPASLPDQEPVPYRPAGPVGSAEAYNALIAEIEAELPEEIHSEIPWPDLRNPDPAQVQVEIFDLWIWVIENHPDPAFARAMTAPDSPSRQETTGVFGEIQADNELHIRQGAPYVAFDHRVVTFASAGLPLWLGRDVPDDAVVVYYQDDSGPTTIFDRDTGATKGAYGGTGARQWLSIMVPTDAGWMLFRDQLIERGDSELDVPALPSPDPTNPRTDV